MSNSSILHLQFVETHTITSAAHSMVYHSVTISTQGDKIGCGIHYVFTVGMCEGETMMHLDVIILYVIVCRELESATFANEMVVVESSEIFNASYPDILVYEKDQRTGKGKYSIGSMADLTGFKTDDFYYSKVLLLSVEKIAQSLIIFKN